MSLLYMLTLFIALTGLMQMLVHADYVCESTEIRTIDDFQQLRNCTHVIGHVRLLNLLVTPQDELRISTAIEEITDYLFVYRVRGLHSLHSIFPKLTLIRGYGANGLLFGEYSLVVYENMNLLNLGLKSLLRIQHGSIRIQSNPHLCFVDTVNWIYMLSNLTKQHYYLENNQLLNGCEFCNNSLTQANENDSNENELNNANNNEYMMNNEKYVLRHCWDVDIPQRPRLSFGNFTKCPTECGFLGCNLDGECCNNNCLSSCRSKECMYCSSLKQADMCVDACTYPYYEFRKSICILDNQCRKFGMIPHAGYCLKTCPTHHQLIADKDGQSSCVPECNGHFRIHSARDLKGLAACNVINGSLTIELQELYSTIIADLTTALRNINEITGYLKVISSPQVISFSFLQNLNTIRGQELVEKKYSLYVIDNFYLESLWEYKQDVRILNGNIYFHLNPHLCYDKIKELQSAIKNVEEISAQDVSPNSNGERAICGDFVHTMNVSIEDCNATAVRIKLKPLSSDDKDLVLRYMYFYKVAPTRNVTIYDSRHGCGHDDWMMEISPNKNVRYVIRNLKPNTQYAFFVKMLTMTDYHRQMGGISNIQYFQTYPSKPEPIARLYYNSLTLTDIMIHWWPPHVPNGIIEKYIINIEETTQVLSENTQNGTLMMLDEKSSMNVMCDCPNTNPYLSGPTPNDEDYYNKPQLVFDEALPDLIYVSIGNSSNKPKVKEESQEDLKALYQRFERHQMMLEEKALAEQDTNTTDFPIAHPLPLCTSTTTQIKRVNRIKECRPVEKFVGIEVAGHVHSYRAGNLTSSKRYQIKVRACVANLDNGCGPEKTILAWTVNRSLKKFYADMLKA